MHYLTIHFETRLPSYSLQKPLESLQSKDKFDTNET